jgi:hypothetical protein
MVEPLRMTCIPVSCLKFLSEDEEGLWIEEGGKKDALGTSRVSLPTFADHRLGLVLRVLHQRLLVNVVDGRPVPNLLVYATLFWWAYKDLDKADQPIIVSDDYPYLTWAGCHNTGQSP